MKLTARQRKLRKESREFAQTVLREFSGTADNLPDAEARFLATRPAYEKLVSAGYLAKCIPEAVGGQSKGLLDTAVLVEELYREDASVALTLIGTILGLQPVVVGGSDTQRKQFLAPFLTETDAPLAGFCQSEPGGSANVAAPAPAEGVRTRAVRDGDGWVLDGRKKWVSSATGWDRKGADLLCVFARTDPDASPLESVSIIAVERPADGINGLVLERAIETPGHRAHLLPEFALQDVRVPAENLIGPEGGGFALSSASFSSANALIGVLGVALMRAAFEYTLAFARKEHRGGAVPIIEHQAVGYALADAKASMEAARSLSWRACAAFDTEHKAKDELAAYAKIFSSETTVRVITELLRVVGVDSYENDCPLNGLLHDALVLPVFAGGNLGVRRKWVHGLLQRPDYDSLSAADGS
ncbi:acyl-CoA dehydrogenase family protein [Pseudonocardia xishanensis]|uniref:Acyl-CoA dehydrogenase family protein n=1 Tax=Pseudonocardia xishanensis TaxID=630995 RepID=A0ABP8RUY9_9PSEU